MWFYIYVTVFFVLALWGVAVLIEGMWLSFLNPKEAPPPTVIITLKPKIWYGQILFVKEKMRWQKCEAIVLFDLNFLEDNEKEDCRKIIKDIKFTAEYKQDSKEVK